MRRKKRLANISWAVSAASVGAVIACARGTGTQAPNVPPPASVEVVGERSQEQWLAARREALAESEAQTEVLTRARRELQGRRLGIPRDAAICFQARHLADKDLRVAMQAGGDFGAALGRWHVRARGVEMFCAYALTVGAAR